MIAANSKMNSPPQASLDDLGRGFGYGKGYVILN
jgi:hypothetical protein